MREEVVADRFAARQRAQRLERGLCPDHGSKPGPSGGCPDCKLQRAIDGGAAALSAPREPEGPPRGSCGECGCRIFLVGPALGDGLCKPCRTELTELRGRTGAATPAVTQPERTGDCRSTWLSSPGSR